MNGRKGVRRPLGEHCPVENESMVFTDELEELVEQTRLSHPRLGRHVDHAQRLLRFIERALQDAEFALSSDKSAEASIDRRVEASRLLVDRFESINPLRLALSPDLVE